MRERTYEASWGRKSLTDFLARTPARGRWPLMLGTGWVVGGLAWRDGGDSAGARATCRLRGA
jgi:hypothetical protein